MCRGGLNQLISREVGLVLGCRFPSADSWSWEEQYIVVGARVRGGSLLPSIQGAEKEGESGGVSHVPRSPERACPR